jgi:hypothetical protein
LAIRKGFYTAAFMVMPGRYVSAASSNWLGSSTRIADSTHKPALFYASTRQRGKNFIAVHRTWGRAASIWNRLAIDESRQAFRRFLEDFSCVAPSRRSQRPWPAAAVTLLAPGSAQIRCSVARTGVASDKPTLPGIGPITATFEALGPSHPDPE